MLIRAEVTNYKSIASADLFFGEENVIVGPNGVGKSNFLDALHFIRDAANDGLDHAITKRHGINSIRRWSKTRPYNIIIKLTFEGKQGSEFRTFGEYRLVISSSGGEYSVVEEEGCWLGPSPIIISKQNENELYSFKRQAALPVEFDIPNNPFSTGARVTIPESELLLSQFGGGSFSEYSFFFQALHTEVGSCGAYSIYPNKIREPQPISNSELLADDGTNLASIVRRMRATTYRGNREQLTSALRQVMPQLVEIRIESAGGFYVPVFRIRENETGYAHDLNMSQISDGTLRMLGMLTAFYQPRSPRRITLEEPEQMIHPGLLPVLIDASRDYLQSTPSGRQIFMTTHSPNLLDMFSPENVIGCSFYDGVSKFHRMSQRQIEIVRSKLFSAGELLVAEGIIP